MGQVFYDMGFLSSTEVIECSASDLVGQFVGQTGPKTKALFEKALGKVLFIDEAYRLSDGQFGKEAIDELIGTLTQERFKAKLVVILAGYDQEVNQLLSVNPGLSSRFPNDSEIIFENISSAMCIKVLEKALVKENITIAGLAESAQLYDEMIILFDQLSNLPSWGNARDIISIAKAMTRLAVENSLSSPQQGSGSSITLSPQDALACMRATLKSLHDRGKYSPQKPLPHIHSLQPPPLAAPPSIRNTAAIKQATKTAPPEQKRVQDIEEEAESVGRDPGVADTVWRQLQADKAAEIEEQKQHEEAVEKTLKDLHDAEEAEETAQSEIAKGLEVARSADKREQEDIMKKIEEERLREAAARADRARKIAELKAQEEAARVAKQKEVQIQANLRELGICPAGFRWIKQAGGYRCQGGAHFVTASELGL
jgi:hypothetical protein